MNKIQYGPQANFSIFEDNMVEMTWEEIQAAADRNAIVLLPLGIVEAHGPHMDLSPDFYISSLYCRFLKQELDVLGIEALIAPNVYWGISDEVARYAGTFSISPETYKNLLKDILKSLNSWGFQKLFIFNAHGDGVHVNTIREVVEESNQSLALTSYCLFDLNINLDYELPLPEMRETGYQPDYHAGAIETSQIYAFFPEKVRRDIAVNLPPSDSFHPSAYCGDPASFELEVNVAEICSVDVKNDALRIKKILYPHK